MLDYLNLKTLLTVLDIALVSLLIYRILLLIRGTRALQMLSGLAIIIGIYFLARVLHLATLEWVIGNFLSSIIIVIIVIFQEEIRRGLTKVGLRQIFQGHAKSAEEELIVALPSVVTELAELGLGALIVLPREVGIEEFLEDAVMIDSQLSRKLLLTIFHKNSPLHDGAVVVENNRIKAAGCFLPLSHDPDLDPSLGTRHRAALGLSERTDALIIVVSEETGTASIVIEGKILRNLDQSELRNQLRHAFERPVETKKEADNAS